MSIWLYGATDCDDTERARTYLQTRGVAFTEVNIDHHPEAAQFVQFVNHGFRSTPTLIVGTGKHRHLWTEPSDLELELIIQQASAATATAV